jgi:hypothetical protein
LEIVAAPAGGLPLRYGPEGVGCHRFQLSRSPERKWLHAEGAEKIRRGETIRAEGRLLLRASGTGA